MNNEDKKIKGYIICESPSIFTEPTVVQNSSCGRVIIKTTLQDADVRNRNKRIYPKEVIQKGLESDYVRERLATKTFYGEAGHPLKPDIQRQLYMDQSNISHIVTSVWWEGNILKGYVEAANTARGADFDGLVRQGSKVGFSLRAVGPITEKRGDTVTVKDPLTIFSYDWILHPSHACAYMDGIISESGQIQGEMSSIITESDAVFIPIYEDAKRYIIESSKNFKVISESLEVGSNNSQIYLSENNKQIYIKENTDTIVVNVEDYLSKEIDDFISKLKF